MVDYYPILIFSMPLIVFLSLWIVENTKLLKSGKVKFVFSYEGYSKLEILIFIAVVLLILIFSYLKHMDLIISIVVYSVLGIIFIIDSNQKIKINEKGIYLDFKFLKWKTIREFRKTEDGKLYIKGLRIISGAHKYRKVKDIEKLILIGSKFIDNRYDNGTD